MTALILIAKEPVPGRVKTRLHPPLSLEEAAAVAAGSLADTFDALAGLPATRRILAWEGRNVPAAAAGYEMIPQVSGGLDERLAAAFEACDGPAVLVGMDTPQLTGAHLAPVFRAWPSDVGAWLGPAADGGFWALALARPDGDLIRGVPMSRDDTGARQRARLEEHGLRVGALDTLTDVDTIDSARRVAAMVPGGRFAAALAATVAGVPA